MFQDSGFQVLGGLGRGDQKFLEAFGACLGFCLDPSLQSVQTLVRAPLSM